MRAPKLNKKEDNSQHKRYLLDSRIGSMAPTCPASARIAIVLSTGADVWLSCTLQYLSGQHLVNSGNGIFLVRFAIMNFFTWKPPTDKSALSSF